MARKELSKYAKSILKGMGYEIIPDSDETGIGLKDKKTNKGIYKVEDIDFYDIMNGTFVPTNISSFYDSEDDIKIEIKIVGEEKGKGKDEIKENVTITTGDGLIIGVSVQYATPVQHEKFVQYEDALSNVFSVEITISNIVDGDNKKLFIVYTGNNIPYDLRKQLLPGIALKEKGSKEPIVRIFHDFDSWGYYNKGSKSNEGFKLAELDYSKIKEILLNEANKYNGGMYRSINLNKAMKIITPAIKYFVYDFLKDWRESLDESLDKELEFRVSSHGNVGELLNGINFSFAVSEECDNAITKASKSGYTI